MTTSPTRTIPSFLAFAAVAALVAGVGACGDPDGKDGGATDAAAGDGTGVIKPLPAKCKSVAGQVGIDRKADFQVSQGGQTKKNGETIAVAAGSLKAGQTLDIEPKFELRNAAPLASAAELRIKSVTLSYTAPKDAPENEPSPFACFLDVDGEEKPCTDTSVLGSLVPAGFDPDCTTGAPAETARVGIRFTKPADALARKAVLTIEVAGDPNWDGKPFALLLATSAGVPKLSLNPGTLDFGVVKFGTTSEVEDFQIVNVGDADLLVSQLDVTLNDGKPWSLELDGKTYAGGSTAKFDPPLAIAKDKSIEGKITFTAVDGGGHVGEIVVHSNDAAAPPTSPNAKLRLLANQKIPCLKVIPDKKLNFGFVAIGFDQTKPLKLESCGDALVEITDLALLEDLGGAFEIDTASITKLGGKPVSKDNPLVLGINEKVTVGVKCTPSSENKDANGKPQPFVAKVQLADNTAHADKAVALECWGSATNCPTPVIISEEGEQIIPQSPLSLKGAQSFAGPGHQVAKWKWELVKKPPGAEGHQFWPNENVPNVQFGVKTKKVIAGKETELVTINVAGEYEFKLTVWDDVNTEACQAAQQTVLVIPDQAIHVELLWDTPSDPDKTDTGPSAGTDLDLHFAHKAAEGTKICQDPPEICPNGKKCYCLEDLDKDGAVDPWFHKDLDCYWFNTNPNWGSFAPEVEDNPSLDLDDTDGWGPENLNLKVPENGVVYSIGVHYWDAHNFFPDDSTATVNIYILGVLKATLSQAMHQCDMWWVKQIDWPSGDIVDFPTAPGGNGKITPKYNTKFAEALGGVCK